MNKPVLPERNSVCESVFLLYDKGLQLALWLTATDGDDSFDGNITKYFAFVTQCIHFRRKNEWDDYTITEKYRSYYLNFNGNSGFLD